MAHSPTLWQRNSHIWDFRLDSANGNCDAPVKFERTLMAELIIQTESGVVIHDLRGDLVTLGRLADNTIVIPDGSVSGHHAEIRFDSGEYELVDLQSSNGTTVNGARIEHRKLNNNDDIRFGIVSSSFKHVLVRQTATTGKADKHVFGRLIEGWIGCLIMTVKYALTIAKLQAIRAKMQFHDLRLADAAAGRKDYELKTEIGCSNLYNQIAKSELQIAELKIKAKAEENAPVRDKVSTFCIEIKTFVYLQIHIFLHNNLLSKLGKEIRLQQREIPEASILVSSALEIQKRIDTAESDILMSYKAVHSLGRQPWILMAGTFLLLLAIAFAYQVRVASNLRQTSSDAVTTITRQQDETSFRGDTQSTFFVQKARNPPEKEVQPGNSQNLSVQEKRDIQDAVSAFVKYASESRTCIADSITWNESNGALEFINQPPLISRQVHQLKFLVGDLDAAKTQVLAEPLYHAYSLSFFTPEDTRFIKDQVAEKDKEDTTTQQNGLFLMFDDQVTAEKAARAINFLSEEYTKKGFKTAVPKLYGVDLLRLLITKMVPNDDVKVESGTLIVVQHLFYEETTTKSVRLSDLDPERFTQDTIAGRSYFATIVCKSKQPLIKVSSSKTGNVDPESSLGFAMPNSHDANRALQVLTELCAEHGWKPDRF